MLSAWLGLKITLYLLFQMAVLNFDCILQMLENTGLIPHETLYSQDGLNFGDIHFCPAHWTLCMQQISPERLWKLLAASAFMPPMEEGGPKLSGTTAILLVFKADSQHERITNVYVRLITH